MHKMSLMVLQENSTSKQIVFCCAFFLRVFFFAPAGASLVRGAGRGSLLWAGGQAAGLGGGPSGRRPRPHVAAAQPAPRATQLRAGVRAASSRRRAGTRQRAVRPTVRPMRPVQPVGGAPARWRPTDGRVCATTSQPLPQSGRRPGSGAPA